jgi:hypothetical protein
MIYQHQLTRDRADLTDYTKNEWASLNKCGVSGAINDLKAKRQRDRLKVVGW